MNFVHPFFLYALAALAIPIIIHLFNFRRFKKVYFTNVKFLREVKEETASRNKLKHLLVLLSRLLALACLVLAFAQPYLPKEETTVVEGKKAVSVYIDNSFSMNALDKDVSLFEKAKRKAREIVQAYGPEDRFQLLTNDFEGKHQRLVNKDEFLGYLEDVEISPKVQGLSDVVNRQKQALGTTEDAQKNVFLISDFQRNSFDIQNDSLLKYYMVPLQSVEQQNVYVDSVWFESPVRMLNQANKLLVRITNTGEAAVENSKLTLRINGQVKALKEFAVEAKSAVIDTINFTITQTGWHNAEVLITDYPINFDDSYYFTFEVAEMIKVLAINKSGKSNYLKALFKTSDHFDFQIQPSNGLDYSAFAKQQLIVLDGLKDLSSGLAYGLQQYVFDGGNVLVFPGRDADKNSYNTFLKAMKANTITEKNSQEREIDYVNTKQEVFKEVFEKMPKNMDMPRIKQAYNFTSYSNTGEEMLLRLKGGRSYLSRYKVGSGNFYLAASSLDKSDGNIATHALFVPMVYKIALVGNQNDDLAYTIGIDEIVETENRANKNESVFKLKGESGEFIPGQKVLGSKLMVSMNNQLKKAGIYELFMEADKPLDYFGFNFDRQESILDYFNLTELKAKFAGKNVVYLDKADKDLSLVVGQIDRGIVLWQWCILGVLLFLLIETLLLRFWKN